MLRRIAFSSLLFLFLLQLPTLQAQVDMDDALDGGGGFDDDADLEARCMGTDWVTADASCEYPTWVVDGECDQPVCADCFDCDPCREYSYTSCDDCTAEGCFWCPGDALCSSQTPDQTYFDLYNKITSCPAQTDWQNTCSTSQNQSDTNVFNDPLYDAWKQIYQLVNVEEVWKRGITGAGIHVRVNDDGVDATHAEFSERFDVTNSCDRYLPEDVDPMDGKPDEHGTTCASIIGAQADNNQCASGIAPGVTMSSCVLDTDISDEDEADLILTKMDVVDISSNSYGPNSCVNVFDDDDDGNQDDDGDDDDDDDDGNQDDDRRRRKHNRRHLYTHRRLQICPFTGVHPNNPCTASADCANGNLMAEACETAIIDYCSVHYELDNLACAEYLDLYTDCEYHVLPPELDTAYTEAVLNGRNGLGTIIVFAAGNEQTVGADVNGIGYHNSRLTITVGATGKRGIHTSYSNTGAAVLVTAPGGDEEYITNTVVAKPDGGCLDSGEGTSYAGPLVAGVVALMLEASNNTLGWRDVQAVLVSTSQKMEEDSEDWTANGAGYNHSYAYGYGVVDAAAAVNASMDWVNFGPEEQILVQSEILDVPIVDDSSESVTSTLTVPGNPDFVTESVVIYLDVFHQKRGDLLVELVSPSGTASVLHPGQRPESTELESDERWKLMTVRNYFENPSGEWKLTITDIEAGPGDTGDDGDLLRSWRMVVYGHLV